METLRGRGKDEGHTESLQVRSPRRDPGVVGRTVQQSIDLRARPRVIDPDLHADHARRARARATRTHRHQRADRDVAEVLAELRRAAIGLHELPPWRVLVLAKAALAAAG